jgi:hypothetical protein
MASKVPYLVCRKGVYATRVQLPPELWAAAGKRAIQRSLHTKALKLAMERHGPMLASINREIEGIRGTSTSCARPRHPPCHGGGVMAVHAGLAANGTVFPQYINWNTKIVGEL